VYRVFEALDELSAIVEEARGVPMTAGCVVPRGDVLELVDDIKDAIPGELDDAQDVLDARDTLLNEAKEHADSTVTGVSLSSTGVTRMSCSLSAPFSTIACNASPTDALAARAISVFAAVIMSGLARL
jgi:cell division septum initiation protein DivIVA